MNYNRLTDWLEDYIIPAIKSDSNWYNTTRKCVIDKNFTGYSNITSPYLHHFVTKESYDVDGEKINSSGTTKTPRFIRAYVNLMLWIREGLSPTPEERTRNYAYTLREAGIVLRVPAPKPNTPEVLTSLNALHDKEKEKETNMKTETIQIKTITFLNGTDVTTLTQDELIDCMNQVDTELKTLKEMSVMTKAVKEKIERIETVRTKLIDLLGGVVEYK